MGSGRMRQSPAGKPVSVVSLALVTFGALFGLLMFPAVALADDTPDEEACRAATALLDAYFNEKATYEEGLAALAVLEECDRSGASGSSGRTVEGAATGATALYTLVSAHRVVVIFDQILDPTSMTAASQFQVRRPDGTLVAATSITIVGSEVRLGVWHIWNAGDVEAVLYTRPTTSPLRGADGNEVSDFSYRAVSVADRTPARPPAPGGPHPQWGSEGNEHLEVQGPAYDSCGGTRSPWLSASEALAGLDYVCDPRTGQWVKIQYS